MIRRRLIRSPFIGLVALGTAAWLWSYCGFVQINHLARVIYGAALTDGRMGFTRTVPKVLIVTGWQVVSSSHGDPGHWKALDKTAQFVFLGMSFYLHGPALFITIPLWLPTLLSALLLWFIWRKTRPQPRGFPIEPAAPTTEAKSPP